MWIFKDFSPEQRVQGVRRMSETIPLKLERIGECIIQVPKDAKLVMDIECRFITDKVWDSVAGKYRKFHLCCMKTWVKQPDGTFKLEEWPQAFLEDHQIKPRYEKGKSGTIKKE
jgi:hypothetical protein